MTQMDRIEEIKKILFENGVSNRGHIARQINQFYEPQPISNVQTGEGVPPNSYVTQLNCGCVILENGRVFPCKTCKPPSDSEGFDGLTTSTGNNYHTDTAKTQNKILVVQCQKCGVAYDWRLQIAMCPHLFKLKKESGKWTRK